MKWQRTSGAVYQLIFNQHHKEFQIFGTFTNMESNSRFGNPKILTEWGFIGADEPLIKSVQAKPDNLQKHWDVEYWIAVYEREEQDDS